MIKRWLKGRLREASTWRAIIGFITIFGIQLNPEQVESIAVAGASIICVIGAFFPDKQPAVELPSPPPPPKIEEQPEWNGKTNGQFP